MLMHARWLAIFGVFTQSKAYKISSRQNIEKKWNQRSDEE